MSPRSPTALIALRHRNFRLLWLSFLVSFTGTFMQTAALLWHVALLAPPGRKGLALGMVGLVRVLPIVLLSIVSGVVADAVDRRRLMVGTQTLAAIVSGALAYLTFRGLTAVWPVYLFAALTSAVNTFDQPARQSLVPNLVPREHLPSAISLISIVAQLAQVCGPALGGVLIAATGVGWAYLFNAVSFVAVVAALLMMRDVKGRAQAADPDHEAFSMSAAREGFRFVFSSTLIRTTMLLDFFATFFSSATALLPIFAQDILHVGASGYGWLYAATAAGSFIASVALVPLVPVLQRRGLTLLWAIAIYGAATVAFGLSHSFWMMFACLAVSGMADTVSTVIRNIIRQLETPDRLRGRMTGINMVFFMGGPQLGELEAGLMANWLGAPFSVVSGGLGTLAVTAWVAATTPALRRYRRTELARVLEAPGGDVELDRARGHSSGALGGRALSGQNDTT